MAQANISSSSVKESIVDNPTGTTLGALILSAVFLLGFPGNLFIIWSILARARRHSVTTLLILNLAIADGSLMALTPFFIAYLVQKTWVFGKVMCKVLFYLCLLNMYASIQLITLMSIYRMVAVLWPQRTARITGKKTVMRVIAAMWVLMMIASVPALVFRGVEKKTNSSVLVCDSFHKGDSNVSVQGLFYILPTKQPTFSIARLRSDLSSYERFILASESADMAQFKLN